MAEPIVYPSVAGQELQRADVDNVGAVAGLMDDRVLAEFLRLTPYDGSNVYRTVVPYDLVRPLGFSYGASPNVATVVPSGSANGSIVINPFRVIVGSRNAANAAPSPTNPAANYQADSLANWRDVRSAVFVGSSTALTQTIQLAANASLSPRWDLVYATVSVDANGPAVSRRIKNPSGGAVTVQSVPEYLQTTVSIGVVTGTVAGTIPALPADTATSFNVPLAAIRVPNPFTSTSTVSTRDVQAQMPNNGWHSLRGTKMRPATGNNVRMTGSGWAWGASGGTRPGPYMPPDWVSGGGTILAAVDCSNATPANWSVLNGGIVDDSIDWRNRLFRVTAMSSSFLFAFDPQAVSEGTPNSAGASSLPSVQLTNGFVADGGLVSGNPTVFSATNAVLPNMAANSTLGLYVDVVGGTGKLLFYGSTTTVPATKVFFWIEYSGQQPNY